MTDQLTFKQAQDLKQVWEIIEACSDNLAKRGLRHWSEYYTSKRIEMKGRDKAGKFFTLTNSDGKVIAAVHLSRRAPLYYTINDEKVNYLQYFSGPDSPAIYVSALAVLPEFQGQGTGKAVMIEVEAWAREYAYKYLRLDARQTGYEWLPAFYQSLGFKIIGDFYEDDIKYVLMEKELEAI